MVNFPGALDSLANPTPTTNRDDVGFEHSTQHANANDAIEALEVKLGVGATAPARNKGLISSASGSVWDVVARRNKLINGDMRVNQRGAGVGSTDNSYILDRWRLLLEAATAAVATQETSDVPSNGSNRALKLTVGAANNNKFGIWQVLEFADVADLRGKTVSLQFKMKATAGIADVRAAVVEFTGTADAVSGDPISAWGSAGTNPTLAASYAYDNTPANLTPTTSWATYRVENVAIGASANNLAVLIWCDDKTTTATTDILRVTDVQLEEGAVCTDVERRPLVLESQLCRRYYRTFGGLVTNELALVAYVYATGGVLTALPLAPEMRATPTLSVSAAADWTIQYGALLTVVCNAVGLEAGTSTPQIAAINATCATTPLTAGQAGRLIANSTSARLNLSAEL